jgi:hypothetical protein
MSKTWVRPHFRAGSHVRGHWRRIPGAAGAGIGLVFVILVIWVVATLVGGDDSGDAAPTWKSGGLTYTQQQASDAMPCATHAYDEVRQYLHKHRCTGLQRVLLIAEDNGDQRALVAVSWVTMPNVAEAQQFQKLVDTSGTGNITSLAADNPSYRNVRFTGRHYDSTRSGVTVVIAEAEPRPGSSPPPWLDRSATVALRHPQP